MPARLIVLHHLLLSHGYEQEFVLSFGHLQVYVAFAPPYQETFDALAQFVQITIARGSTSLIEHNVPVFELIIGAKCELVYQFGHRIEFFQAVFQRRTR